MFLQQYRTLRCRATQQQPTSTSETAAYSASCSCITLRLFATESDASSRTSRLSLVIIEPSSDPVDVVRRRRFSSMILRNISDRGRFPRRFLTAALLPVRPMVAFSGRKTIPHVIPFRIIAPVMKFAPCNRKHTAALQCGHMQTCNSF